MLSYQSILDLSFDCEEYVNDVKVEDLLGNKCKYLFFNNSEKNSRLQISLAYILVYEIIFAIISELGVDF